MKTRPARTKTWSEQLGVEVRQELLVLCIELAHSGDDVAGQAHAHNLHDSLKDEQREIGEVGMRAVLLFEDFHEAIAAIFIRLSAHGDKTRRGELGVAQAQGLWAGEERHCRMPAMVWGWARAADEGTLGLS